VLTHFEDHGLAQAVHRELQQLRVREPPATAEELATLARKADEPPGWQPRNSRKKFDDARANTRIAINELAERVSTNLSSSLFWKIALDRAWAWVQAAE
jgi:hypothetical protein